jgi:hypothetical protein
MRSATLVNMSAPLLPEPEMAPGDPTLLSPRWRFEIRNVGKMKGAMMDTEMDVMRRCQRVT